MLTTITTDGAGVILVTWKFDFSFCKRYFSVPNLQMNQELSSFHSFEINQELLVYHLSNLDHGQNFWHLPLTRSSIEKPVS